MKKLKGKARDKARKKQKNKDRNSYFLRKKKVLSKIRSLIGHVKALGRR